MLVAGAEVDWALLVAIDVGFDVMTVVGLVVGFVVGFVVVMEVAMDVAVDAFMVEVAALALDVEIGAVVDAGCDDEGIALEADETMPFKSVGFERILFNMQ